MVTLTPLLLVPGLTLLSLQRARLPSGDAHAPTEPGWQQAYRRVAGRTEDGAAEPETDAPAPEPLAVWQPPATTPRPADAPARAAPAGRVDPPTATAVRMAEAVRQVASPDAAAPPAARLWEVHLPGTAPGWQLQISQAQPQAPLALELRVPPVMAAQAQQQLADLDRRLRDGGHELLRSRLRPGTRASDRRRPGDEVEP